MCAFILSQNTWGFLYGSSQCYDGAIEVRRSYRQAFDDFSKKEWIISNFTTLKKGELQRVDFET